MGVQEIPWPPAALSGGELTWSSHGAHKSLAPLVTPLTTLSDLGIQVGKDPPPTARPSPNDDARFSMERGVAPVESGLQPGGSSRLAAPIAVAGGCSYEPKMSHRDKSCVY